MKEKASVNIYSGITNPVSECNVMQSNIRGIVQQRTPTNIIKPISSSEYSPF